MVKVIFKIKKLKNLLILLRNLKFVTQSEKKMECVILFVTRQKMNMMEVIVLNKKLRVVIRRLCLKFFNVIQYAIQLNLILMKVTAI